MTDNVNIGDIGIILTGFDVKLEITLMYWTRSIQAQLGREQR